MKQLLLFLATLALCLPVVGKTPETPAPASAAANVVPPKFQDGDVNTFKSWMFEKLVFFKGLYQEGDKLSASMMFNVSRSGAIESIRVDNASEPNFGQQLEYLARIAPAWTPGYRDGKRSEELCLMDFDVEIVQGPGNTLRATDYSVNRKADKMPLFEGRAKRAFGMWMQERIDTLVGSDTIRASVDASFIVEKNGSLSNIRVASREERFNAFLEGIIARSPDWTPGETAGEPVRVRCDYKLLMGMDPDEMEAALDEPIPADSLLAHFEMMPKFGGEVGLNGFRNWVMQNVKFPQVALEAGIQGRVVVSFVVGRDGTVGDVEVIESPHYLLTLSTVALIRRSPKWGPGVQDGKPVRVKFTMPVDFKLWR